MFQLQLSNPSRLVVEDALGVGTIVDDDGWVIDDESVWENNRDGKMVFIVTRDHTSEDEVVLSYSIADAGSAVGGSSCDTDGVDYLTPSGLSVTLQPDDKTATISITLCDDDEVEGRETLLVELTGVPGRKLTGVGTIVSDDR